MDQVKKKEKGKWGKTARIKKTERVSVVEKAEGEYCGYGSPPSLPYFLSSHLASLCLLPSFPSSRFLSLPVPVEIT